MLKKLKYIFSYYTICGFNDKNIDKKFNDYKKEHSYKQITYISAVTGILYILLSVVNRYTSPEEIAFIISNLQLFIIAPFIFFVSYLGYTKKKFLYLELSLFLAPIFAASFHMYVISHLNNYNTYQTELYLMLFWIYTISGLRFIHSIISSFIVFFIGVIGSYLLYPNQHDSFIIYTTWMAVSMIFGFVGGYLLQESQKSTFKKQLELESIASKDKLTGLYNRVKLDEILNLELQRSQRYNHKAGVMMLDIDFFKPINDTHGHLVGDNVLVKIAECFRKNIRSSDTVFRWGGEEFVILSPETDINSILDLAELIRQKIEDTNFPEVGKITISIGVTISNPDDNLDSIIKRADEALYLAKNSGRNCVRFS